MSTVWSVVKTQNVEPDPELGPPEPEVMGVFTKKRDAVEHALKLYISDDIDLKFEPKELEGMEDGMNGDYRPTSEIIKQQKRLLATGQVNSTYSYAGNIYTICENQIGASTNFDDNVSRLYLSSKSK